MKKCMLLAGSAILLASPQIVLAQAATATVDVTGTVAGRCTVESGGTPGPAATGLIALGELAGTDGRLATGVTGATIAGAQANFRVICTGATPRVQLSATRLLNAASAPAGYSNAVNYTAQVEVTQATGTAPNIAYTTNSPAPAATNVVLTGPLANAADNVKVRVHSLTTTVGALLIAGPYGGQISVTITPS